MSDSQFTTQQYPSNLYFINNVGDIADLQQKSASQFYGEIKNEDNQC